MTYEFADQHQGVTDCVIQHQPNQAVTGTQDHFCIFFSHIERKRSEHLENFVQ